MFTIAKLPLWQDFGFGLLLMVLVTVAAERLGRYIEADAVQRRLTAGTTRTRRSIVGVCATSSRPTITT